MSVGSAAWAIPGQSTTPAGAGFASACSGNGFSGISSVGNAMNNGVSTSFGSPPTQQALTCAFETSTVGGIASTPLLSTVSSFNGHAYSNSAKATAGVGVIKLQSTNTGSSATNFSGAGAQGGWNDSLTVTGGPAGTQALLVVPIHVIGQMTSFGQGANGLVEVGIYRNNAVLQPYGATINADSYNLFKSLNSAFNPVLNQTSVAEGTVLFGWDYQMKPFGAVDYGASTLTTNSLTIDQVVRFVVPFTWGQAFTLGIYAATSSGETASGGAVVSNTATAAFQDTIYWDSGAYVLPANGVGSPITNFVITASSGADYSAAFVPEPATLALLAAGALAVPLVRRRR